MKVRRILIACSLLILIGCTVSYKFTGASIDYSRIKNISISTFQNQAPLVYPPLSQSFTEGLKSKFLSQTKLKLAKRDGHLQLEGEIVGYDLTPMAQGSDGYATETKLTVTVNVRYTNTLDSKQNFEQKISAYRTFPNTSSLESVQEALVEEISKEIFESIFNKTVANW
jgi:hypothetical protein